MLSGYTGTNASATRTATITNPLGKQFLYTYTKLASDPHITRIVTGSGMYYCIIVRVTY